LFFVKASDAQILLGEIFVTNNEERELYGDGQPSITVLQDGAGGKHVKDATYVGDEDRPYIPPPNVRVEQGIQNIDANTNLQLLRQEGVHTNSKTGQVEPRRQGLVSPSRIKHLPGKTAEEKRARVRTAQRKAFAVGAKENKKLLRDAGQLPRNPTGWYKDRAGYVIEGNLLVQYNENCDDVQAIAHEQDQNPAQFENQTINQSENTPLAGSAEDEFINPHATKSQGPTADEPKACDEKERKWQLRDQVYDSLSPNDKQVYNAFAEGKTAQAITEELGYTPGQIASLKRRLKRSECRVISASRAALRRERL
jgi:hypothetical protein